MTLSKRCSDFLGGWISSRVDFIFYLNCDNAFEGLEASYFGFVEYRVSYISGLFQLHV